MLYLSAYVQQGQSVPGSFPVCVCTIAQLPWQQRVYAYKREEVCSCTYIQNEKKLDSPYLLSLIAVSGGCE